MKGSVSKYTVKGSSRARWRYRIDAGKAAQGRRIQDGRGGFEKQADAIQAMRQHMSACAKTAHASMVQQTFGQWVQEWIETYGSDHMTPKSIQRYGQLARYILNNPDGSPSALSKVPLRELTHQQLEAALRDIYKAPAKRREHISARTLHHIAGVLHVSLRKAYKLDMIATNIMDKVELPAWEKKEAHSLTPEQIQDLRVSLRGDYYFPFVELALASGARRGEALALQWTDLNLKTPEPILTISKSLEQVGDVLRIKTTKNKKSRKLHFSRGTMITLEFLRDQQNEHRRLYAGTYHDLNLIFCKPDGSYLRPDLVSQHIVRRLKKAGIVGASLHTLRHSHASYLLSNGVPLPIVSQRLGHSSVAITAPVYSHALPGDDARAVAAWDKVIDDGGGDGTVQ